MALWGFVIGLLGTGLVPVSGFGSPGLVLTKCSNGSHWLSVLKHDH